MLPIVEGVVRARARGDVCVKDAHLRRVLSGEAFLLFDGGMGTMLQRAGLAAGELPELLCLTQPDAITAVHRAYVEAGSQAITTNTFGANREKLGGAASVNDVFAAAVACARAAGARYVAADIGPTGALLQPLGTLTFDDAYDLFAEQVRAATAAGADLIIIETMADLLEAKAAVLAAKECSDLPVFATMTFGEDGRTFLGTTPAIAARTLDALGVDALGINCSLGPADLAPLVREMLAVTSRPVIVQANAGLPSVVEGETVYSIGPQDYVAAVAPIVDAGAGIVGGCCGTDPTYIEELARLIEGRAPTARDVEPTCALTSAQQEVVLRGRQVAVIGERINPTGKARLKEALRSGDYNYVVGEAIAQAQAGADLLDVNAGLPELDEPAVLAELVKQIQGVCALPLQVDSSDPRAVEAAVRAYSGKPLINSVNGKRESLETVLPIAAHYGCAVVGLTLDEDGIPPTADGRFAIAERIVRAAQEAGIPRADVYIDCLVMSASTNQAEIPEIMEAVSLVKRRLGVRTVLGASNVSFGLPARPVLNATFLAAAFAAGLDLPITNPLDVRLREVVNAWKVLCGQDVGAGGWIACDWSYLSLASGRVARGCGGLSGLSEPSGGAASRASGKSPLGGGAGLGGDSGNSPKARDAVPPEGSALFRERGGSALKTRDGATPENSTLLQGEGSAMLSGGDADAAVPEDPSLLRANEGAAAFSAVLSGLKGDVGELVQGLLDLGADPMEIVNSVLIPALDEVGARFEAGTFFLPQLMASAEAAKAGFEVIRRWGAAADSADSTASVPGADGAGVGVAAGKGPIVLATVKGDIHDIGKNIVRMLLDNYGYRVIDLGRDVDPQVVVDAVHANDAPLVGLSALMTTTVRSMEDTISLLRQQTPQVKVFVGGAVLNPEYAQMVGADFYAKDAAESARIAAEVLG